MKSFINKVRDFFAKRAEKKAKDAAEQKAKDEYILTGIIFCYSSSYMHKGECCGFKEMLKLWEQQERKIVEYGYRPIDLDAFVEAGGYDKELPELEKLKEDEEPVFHAKIYREKYKRQKHP